MNIKHLLKIVLCQVLVLQVALSPALQASEEEDAKAEAEAKVAEARVAAYQAQLIAMIEQHRASQQAPSPQNEEKMYQMYRHLKQMADKKKYGFFLSGYVQLILGMGLSELFFAVTSKDPKKIEEWALSITQLEFHMTMSVFHFSMTYSNMLYRKILGGGIGAQQIASYLGLGTGDVMAAIAGKIYHNPTWELIRQTYDPHRAFADPEVPGSLPDNTLARRIKVRQHLRGDYYLKAMKDVGRDFQKWDTLGIPAHGAQLVFVQWVFGKSEARVLTMARKVMKKTKNGVVAQWVVDPALSRLWVVTPEVARIMKNGVRSISLVKDINFAAWGESLKYVGGMAKWMANRSFHLAAFFVLDHLIGDFTIPAVHTNYIYWNLARDEERMNTAIDWFVDPKRKNDLPWQTASFDNPITSWWTNDSPSRSKLFIKFFLNGADLKSADYKALAKGTNYEKQEGLSAGFILDAANFMDRFSAKYFGVNDLSEDFYKCMTKSATQYNEPSVQRACSHEWYQKASTKFVAELKAYKTEQYVQTSIMGFDAGYDRYRSEVIMGRIYEKWQRWSTSLVETMRKLEVEENYFKWIARGLKPKDRRFTENKNFWHPATDDPKALHNEIAVMTSQFDVAVLGELPYRMRAAGDHVHALKVHKAKLDTFLPQLSKKLTREDVIEAIKFLYSGAFGDVAPEATEIQTTRNRLLRNYVGGETTELDAADVKLKNEATNKRARWLAEGMADTPEYLANEGGWHKTREEDEYTLTGLLLTEPFFTAADPQSKTFQTMTIDLVKLLKGDNNITPRNRAQIALVTTTIKVLADKKKSEMKRIDEENASYLKGLQDLIYDKWWARDFKELGVKTVNWIFDPIFRTIGYDGVPNPWLAETNSLEEKDYLMPKPTSNVFYRGGMNDFQDTWKPTIFKARPRGLVNAFNDEILELLNQMTKVAKKIDFNVKASEYQKPSFLKHPDGVVKGLDAVITLMELAKAQNKAQDIISDVADISAAVLQLLTYTPAYRNPNKAKKETKLEVTQNPMEALMAAAYTCNPATVGELKKRLEAVYPSATRYTDADFKTPKGKAAGKQEVERLTYKIAEIKQRLLNTFKQSMNRIESLIVKRNNNPASSTDEDALREAIDFESFSLPLMALTFETDKPQYQIMAMLGGHIVEAQNNKTIKARYGCFILNDPLCSPQTEH